VDHRQSETQLLEALQPAVDLVHHPGSPGLVGDERRGRRPVQIE
jgi:hypothetical protein